MHYALVIFPVFCYQCKHMKYPYRRVIGVLNPAKSESPFLATAAQKPLQFRVLPE